MNAPRPEKNAPLPDAESLFEVLLGQLKPRVSHSTGIVGIVTGGAWLAERLHAALGLRVPLGILDVSFYRDDVGEKGIKPQISPSQIPFEIEARDVLLVDDVLFTGRTVRAAMNELFDYGRPARIDLAVLADRGGRELPVEPRYCGGKAEVPKGSILMLDRDAQGGLSLRLSAKRRERGAEA
ncbi:MAG: bifunctional pyr operon transcriptional regulator/uracil phosphoribosyltransferase PyrR [Betaproteobacteria bacterium]|nr:bifunctional pyr operon transcriptional regulator/uracil phosphoribosyltransferase PyrR [Betaproteobacteria bacterium]